QLAAFAGVQTSGTSSEGVEAASASASVPTRTARRTPPFHGPPAKRAAGSTTNRSGGRSVSTAPAVNRAQSSALTMAEESINAARVPVATHPENATSIDMD